VRFVTPPQNEAVAVCRVRALNLTGEGTALDVFLGGALLANSLPYGRSSPYVRLRAGAMTAAAFLSGTAFRVVAQERVATRGRGVFTLVVTGYARKGAVWLVEDAPEARPRTVRLVHAAPGVRRAALTIVGKRTMAAGFKEATPYAVWPAQEQNLALRAQYEGETVRVRVPGRMQHDEQGAHSVYLAGRLPAPPEAVVIRDGPEY
jgi:hypothetical protein